VIVQTEKLGDSTTSVLLCPITSDVTGGLPVRPIVEADENNGLRVRSQIMTDKLLALPRSRVRRVIGRIDPETSSRLDTALLLVLGLAR
jgi:mRNA interferase MazF